MYNTKVYVILQELPHIVKDHVIVKIGISNDVEVDGKLYSYEEYMAIIHPEVII